MIAFDLYANQTSYSQTEFVEIHAISRTAQAYHLRIVKIGGATFQLDTLISLPANTSPLAINVDSNGCNWPTIFTKQVPSNWSSGVYSTRMWKGTGTTDTATTIFVVKAPAGSKNKILYELPVATFQAYNSWGSNGAGSEGILKKSNGIEDSVGYGKSLYDFKSSGGIRSPKVSFDRPGAMSESQADMKIYHRPFIEWLNQHQDSVDFCTSIDLHNSSTILQPYNLLISAGHNEYWSKEMRDHVEDFASQGGSVAFLSGNTCWWQVRFERNGRTMVCYKFDEGPQFFPNDPQGGVNDALLTAHWIHDRVKRSETSLTGVSYRYGSECVGCDRTNIGYEIWNPGTWAYKGLTLQNGALIGIGTDLVGYETDAAQLSVDQNQNIVKQNGVPVLTYAGGTPANFRLLASADLRTPPYSAGNPGWRLGNSADNGGFATMGYWRKDAGTVFTAGTTGWVTALSDPTVSTITQNIIDQLTTKPTFQYHAVNSAGEWRFLYSQNPNVGNGWTKDEEVFNAYDYRYKGAATIPIYQYYAVTNGQWRFLYSTNSNVGNGWTNDGVAFYAFSDTNRGGKPIYQFRAPNQAGGYRYVYSTDSAPYSGWTSDGIAFYAYSKVE